jgi:hypothetical protein
MSATWTGLVGRDGSVFLGRAGVPLSDYDTYYAPIETQTTFCDVIALGLMQRLRLEQFADELVRFGDPVARAPDLRRVERELARFRIELWWQDVASFGHANRILDRAVAAHRSQELFAQLRDDIRDYAQLCSTEATERTNALLGLITLLGFALGAPIALLAAYPSHPEWVWLLWVPFACMALVAGLGLRAGRELLAPLVRGLRPVAPRGVRQKADGGRSP